MATGVAMAWDEGELRGLRVGVGVAVGGGFGLAKLLLRGVVGESPIPLGVFGMHIPACR